jgi:hypothetical protein
MFEFDNVCLDRMADISKDSIIMAIMHRQTEFTIKSLIDATAVFNFSFLMLFAHEFPWLVNEVLHIIDHWLLLFLKARLELFERICCFGRGFNWRAC